MPLEVAEALVEDHGRAQQEIGDRVVRREGTGEHVKRIRRNGLRHVDAGVPELAADLHQVRAVGPGHGVLNLESVLCRVAWTRNRASDR
jgi:hypothetical protein